MAFWNRKKEISLVDPSQPTARDMLNELKEELRMSRESHTRMTESLLRSNNELIKALDKTTREFKKTR